MNPFEVPRPMEALRETYPRGEDILVAASLVGREHREAIVRLWLSEGIPFAFKELPALYEAFREALARCLSAHPKEVTLVGSARLGTSVAGGLKCGKAFGVESDLDWAVVSSVPFGKLRGEFVAWSRDYQDGSVHPRGPNERYYWDNNVREVPRNLRRGFIDLKRIPWWLRYRTAQEIADRLSGLDGGLKAGGGALDFRKSTLRAYRDWSSFIRQVTLSLESASKSFTSMAKSVEEPLRTREATCSGV